jgi:hypothetical protein
MTIIVAMIAGLLSYSHWGPLWTNLGWGQDSACSITIVCALPI